MVFRHICHWMKSTSLKCLSGALKRYAFDTPPAIIQEPRGSVICRYIGENAALYCAHILGKKRCQNFRTVDSSNRKMSVKGTPRSDRSAAQRKHGNGIDRCFRRALSVRSSAAQEMYIVRYADDYKIFCRKQSDADKVFIAVNYRAYQVLRNVLIIGKELSCILRQAISAVPERRIIVIRSYARVKAYALDDLSGAQPVQLGVAVELVEKAHS